jgi:hypothetical protein
VGTYSDLHLHFTFRQNTPEEVLATFSPLIVEPPDGRGAPTPTLPSPEPEPWENWMPDYRAAYVIGPGDPEIDPIARSHGVINGRPTCRVSCVGGRSTGTSARKQC